MNRDEQWLLKEKYGGVENDLSADQSAGFEADCQRLAASEPLGYVIGQVPFLDCEIWLDSHPLIPRPETEYWVEKAISNIRTSAKGSPSQTGEGEPFAIRVLDLCAGSGAIGVAVAKAVPEAQVTFAEIDTAHLPTIKKNIETNLSVNRKVSHGRFQVIQSDLFNSLPEAKEVKMLDEVRGVGDFLREPYVEYGDEENGPHNKEIREHFHLFDFILTNPPYIDAQANTVETSVVAHEPHLALFGGSDGMEIIRRIVVGARASLAPHGQLWIEHEPFQTDAITTLAIAQNFTITTHNDQYNTPRYSLLKLA